MTGWTWLLAGTLVVAVIWCVICVLAAKHGLRSADAAELQLAVERGVVAVQREEIAALALRLIDAGLSNEVDELRWLTYRADAPTVDGEP